MDPSAEALEEFARAYPTCGAADRALILEQNRLLPGGRGAVGSGAQAYDTDSGWSLWRTALLTVAVLGPSPIPPVIVTRALAENRQERLRAALLAMHEDAEGRAILADVRIPAKLNTQIGPS